LFSRDEKLLKILKKVQKQLEEEIDAAFMDDEQGPAVEGIEIFITDEDGELVIVEEHDEEEQEGETTTASPPSQPLGAKDEL